MNPDPLLDALAPPDDPVFRASLDQTLRAVRRQRHVRAAARSAVAGAVVILMAMGWFRRPPATSDVAARVSPPPTVVVQTSTLPLSEVVSTRPAPDTLWVAAEPASTAWIITDAPERVEQVDDVTLLALAHGCLALTQEGRTVKAVWLCDDLLAQP